MDGNDVRRAGLCAMTFLAAAGIASGGHGAAGEWKPERSVEIVVAANPGGGADAAARTVHRILQDRRLVSVPVTVANKPGGGAIAFNYMNQRAADGHFLTLGTAPLITSHIIGQTQFTYSDFTPIAMLYTEFVVISVKADSPIKTAQDLVARFKKDPEAVNVGVSTSRSNTNHIAVASLFKAAGGDVKRMKAVIFDSGGKGIAALLGGHVDVVPSNASLVMPHVKSGAVRIIGVAAPERLGNLLADVPTFRERGLDVVSSNWRAILGPRGLNQAQVTHWEDVFAKLVEADEFKQEVKKRQWVSDFRRSKETARAFKAEYDELKIILSDLGLAK